RTRRDPAGADLRGLAAGRSARRPPRNPRLVEKERTERDLSLSGSESEGDRLAPCVCPAVGNQKDDRSMKEVTARFWVAFSGVDRSYVFASLRKFVPEKEAHDRLWDRFVNHMHREDDHDDYSTVAGSVEVADIDDLFDVLNVVREAKPYDYSIRVGVDRGPIR